VSASFCVRFLPLIGWAPSSLPVSRSLLDPAYGEIGPNTCVGMTGNWSVYSWPPAIVLVSVMLIFLLDFGAERWVAKKYGLGHGPDGQQHSHDGVEGVVTTRTADHSHLHSSDQDDCVIAVPQPQELDAPSAKKAEFGLNDSADRIADEKAADEVERSFRQQISAFFILEFGVIFHSVIIGLTLGTAGDEFATLYPVIVFHQTFEGLGIGARLSAIPIPTSFSWLPWFLCAAYGLATPIAIAIGLGLRNTYNGNSYTANVVSGILDSISAGILIYTGLVELLARDLLFNTQRMKDSSGRLTFMICCTFLGAGLMALLGKWA
jgi:zinc transporter 1/2/3